MSEWRETSLGAVADIVVGYAYKSAQFSDLPTDTRLLRGVNIGQGFLDWGHTAWWPSPEHGSRYRLDEGDVVLAMDRPWIEAGLKRARIRATDLPALLVQRVARLRGTDHSRTSFIHHLLATDGFSQYLQNIVTGATVPHISQTQIEAFPVAIPSLDAQDKICDLLDAIDDLIENNRRRVEVLEEMARAIYREWFVHFRYPGHEGIALVDSPLGPIPDGWPVKRVRELGATGAGPFGSKLGRKDYVSDGVPVLRGANLRVGGAFDESQFVYVTTEKAEELRSSTAWRGDVVITQRGTLGQIGHIPETSDHERYVLSQSQMKLTVNADAANAEFVYRQMSTAEVTARFIAQAMSSGVPHVNLTLLREFEILAPPSDLQHQFGDTVRGLDQEASALRAQARTLAALRDLLLPKLVTGQIDVSQLDLKALVEERVL